MRRFDRSDRVLKPRQPTFDARSRILESRERNKQLRHVMTDNVSTFSWKESGRGNMFQSTSQRPSTVPTSMFRNSTRGMRGSGGSRGGNTKQDVLSVMSDGTAGRGTRLRAL